MKLKDIIILLLTCVIHGILSAIICFYLLLWYLDEGEASVVNILIFVIGYFIVTFFSYLSITAVIDKFDFKKTW